MPRERVTGWQYDEQDTPQQKAILRQNRSAQAARKKFPVGTRVEPERGGPSGVVKRHVPGNNAQGGKVIVEWENGKTGTHGPIALRPKKKNAS